MITVPLLFFLALIWPQPTFDERWPDWDEIFVRYHAPHSYNDPRGHFATPHHSRPETELPNDLPRRVMRHGFA